MLWAQRPSTRSCGIGPISAALQGSKVPPRTFLYRWLQEQQSISLGWAPMQGMLRVLMWRQSRVGARGGGGVSYQHLPCCAWQRLGLVHCRHPQSQAGSPWDEVKMHYFHLLAAAERPRASCLCLLALRQAKQTQPATSALGIGAGELLRRR